MSIDRWKRGSTVPTSTPPPLECPSSTPHTVQEGYFAACISTVRYASSDSVYVFPPMSAVRVLCVVIQDRKLDNVDLRGKCF